MAKTKEQAVIVCTTHRGVFFGYTEDTQAEIIKLKNARNCYYWATPPGGGGILSLGSIGPTKGSKIGHRADIELRNITAVIACTPEAVKAWEEVQWG